MNNISIGQKFGDLEVIEIIKQNSRIFCICKCKCGGTSKTRSDGLLNGRVTTCGCRGNNLIGRCFGKLTVEKEVLDCERREIQKRRIWRCICECGNYKDVSSRELLIGDTNSCGCLAGRKPIHGHRSRLGEKSQSKSYTAWCNMKARCLNETNGMYKNYGGRGIKICDQWLESFPIFLADMGEPTDQRYSLERLDVNGNYEPDNVVWASSFVQAMNKQETQTEYQDLKDTLKKFCEMTDVDYAKLISRLHSGDPMLPLLG
jgi:hypothetical protein